MQNQKSKTLKSCLSMAITLIFVIGIVPFTAFAATATPIESVGVLITAPIDGQTPSSDVTLIGVNYTCTAVKWSTAAAFKAGSKYTVKLTFAANSGYSFANPLSLSINGISVATSKNAGATAEVSYSFTATPAVTPPVLQTVSSVSADIIEPADGQTPSTSATVSGTGYTCTEVKWATTAAFKADTKYTAKFTFTANR